jgi:hypothetical protein
MARGISLKTSFQPHRRGRIVGVFLSVTLIAYVMLFYW